MGAKESVAMSPARDGVFAPALRQRLERARDKAVAALRSARDPAGGWTGELSASALSTATAVTALSLAARADPDAAPRLRPAIRGGYRWLTEHQNADGGWGDTPRSFSNISATTLVWAALHLGRESGVEAAQATAVAERWLQRAAGSLAPDRLVAAIERRYGDDRTFSIPILTMCAVCGRLGGGEEGWRRVRQLPFELAVLPQRWFGALQLPVVSYALPALIAIGQLRHGMRPTRNSLLRALRNRCRAPTLDKLARLQPPNGGFLEAAPLTSFVTMSLAALGLSGHPVARRGVAFLEASVRPDGSWPIDTNLATWLTTLAVNALGGGGWEASLSLGERATIRAWLLGQQFRLEHPYTLAAPGGWAWTNLPGGVPDADDTAGAALALHRLDPANEFAGNAIAAGVNWLLDLQNRDGGMPTFCRGWGKLPFDRSSPDLTAHAIRAWTAVSSRLERPLRRRTSAALRRAARFLVRSQRPDGAWIPLWFGHQQDPADENPLYGTARVIPALAELESAGWTGGRVALEKAMDWIVARQNDDGGWTGASGAASTVEETGLALEALATTWEYVRESGRREAVRAALTRGAAWLSDAVEQERWHTPVPIGLYFAKLWYFERLYPLIFATGALARLTRVR